ncbi:MAG: GAF domain-containing sensor histidine kinase [Armatimonadetes bacterium]|nr:GAF domain-containing sensor histidine kinase [Anaerolineae bacterium]
MAAGSDYPYLQLLQAAGYASFTLNAAWQIGYADANAAALTAYPAKAMLGQSIFHLFPADWHDQLRASYAALGDGEYVLLQSPLLTAGDLFLWVEQVVLCQGEQWHMLLRDATLQLPSSAENAAAIAITEDITNFQQMQTQLHQQVDQLTMLQKIDMELNRTLDSDYVLALTLDSAVRLSEANAGFIALYADNQLQQLKAIGEYPEGTLRAFLNRRLGVVSRAMRLKLPQLVLDVTHDPDYVPLISRTCSQIVVPLVSREKLVGVLNLETNKPGRFTAQTLEFIRLIITRTAIAIDNAELYQQTIAQLSEMQTLLDRVSKLEQLKTDMIRIAAHDLRNPLTIILSYCGMLQMELKNPSELPQPLENYINPIEHAAQVMRKIILDILSLERIEAAAQSATLQRCDLHPLITQSFADAHSAAQLKAQHYTLHAMPGDAMVIGDPVQLLEAATNLISNAIKYTPDAGQIDVYLELHAERTDWLIFRVMDNGYGVPYKQQARLFQPFFRAQSKETRNIEGSGLGLHLVKNIVERHGGNIIFSSEYGKGSTFGFELPLLRILTV